MRNKLLFRMWLSRLVQYLIIPTVLCVILLPLYNILHQQTIKAQLTDASEQLASSVSTFENYLYNIRYVTNKLFHDSSYNILAVSSDDYALGDNATGQTASRLLEDLTYSMSPVSYSYVTFARNHRRLPRLSILQQLLSGHPGIPRNVPGGLDRPAASGENELSARPGGGAVSDRLSRHLSDHFPALL